MLKAKFCLVFFLGLFFSYLFGFSQPVLAVTASGTWSAADIIRQSGTVKLNIPTKGGAINGTFSGSGSGFNLQYGGRFSGTFSGGWGGEMNGTFSGWAHYEYNDPRVGGTVPVNQDIYGNWSGRLNSDGTGYANFHNRAKYGLAGSVNLHYSVDQFEKEYGSPPPGSEASPAPSPESSPEPSPSPTASPTPSPSPSPSPSPNPKELKIVSLTSGQGMEGVTVTLNLKNGERKEVEIVNGKINFDANEVRSIVIKDSEGRSMALTDESFNKQKVVMGNQEEWKNHLISQMEHYATILNGGEPVNLEDYFKINWNSDENSVDPPLFDFFRKLGAKDTINFSSDQLLMKGDIDTAAHEVLGHALIELIGKDNELEYAGYAHDDIWQPGYDERGWYNPARWFGDKKRQLTDEESRGLAFSEGWAQYVGDKWQRELTDTADQESPYTVENALENMNRGREGHSGQMYADESGFGAKTEGVVATVFNRIYEEKDLEEVVADYTKVREAYKQVHDGKVPQNINDYLEQKLEMSDNESEKNRIKELMVTLELEKEKTEAAD